MNDTFEIGHVLSVERDGLAVLLGDGRRVRVPSHRAGLERGDEV